MTSLEVFVVVFLLSFGKETNKANAESDDVVEPLLLFWVRPLGLWARRVMIESGCWETLNDHHVKNSFYTHMLGFSCGQ